MDLVWQPQDIAYEPEVLARRITSFLSNSSFVLRGVRKQRTKRYMRTLVATGRRAAFKTWRHPSRCRADTCAKRFSDGRFMPVAAK